mmetsp:Transcript_27388/g.82184  ORF Transcript_27388/g.82184 Transcript_27388/m.82184 type:complete len:446 (-) Transcript_27388:22-1359(-)
MDDALLAPPGTESMADDAKARRRVVTNFLLMCVCFSVNHGTVTAVISLAGSELGPSLGNASLGVLYCVYTLTAAFASHAAVRALGAKRTLLLGLGTYCLYVASYLVAIFQSGSARYGAVMLGAVLGGAAAGCLWPAQGAYYARSAERYAAAASCSREQANSKLGAYFSTCYLVGELAMKLLSSILPAAFGSGANTFLYVFYAIAAFLAAAGVLLIDDVDQGLKRGGGGWGATALSASRLLVDSPLARCTVPMNFAFGFGAAYLNGYFFTSVVTPGVGADKIGYVSALVVATAAAAALPLGRAGERLGDQAPLVAFGAACFLAFGLANLAFGASLGAWAALVPLALVFGTGRSVWETNFKASFADYFPDNKEAAFANVQLQSGFASTVGFFLNPHISPAALAWVAVLCAATAIVSQLLAARIHKRRRGGAAPGYAAVGATDSGEVV